MNNNLTTELMQFIDASPSMFHAASSITSFLDEHNFEWLDPKSSWSLKQGGHYYTKTNDSAVIAFRVDHLDIETQGFKIVGAHTDVPGFRIKPNPMVKADSYIKLNTEVYGGPILNTWLDRPLSAAGRVSLKSNDLLHPKTELVDLKAPILIIPNLAIHMNREVNSGVKLNPQKDIQPLLAFAEENIDTNIMLELVAKELNVNIEDILDIELYLYPTEKSQLVGLREQFISAPRLDDLSMTYSALYGLVNSTSDRGISVVACFDNEEIGSRTKQGADSPFLAYTLERIALALGKSREDLFRALDYSFVVSADVAHLHHPNYPEKSDPTNKVLPGKGPAIKINSNFSYTTDSDSAAVFANICQASNIPYQTFVNRSDEKGGSTIGPVSTSHLPIRSVDIGTPMLSMHSARELMTTEDFLHTCEALKAFFSA